MQLRPRLIPDGTGWAIITGYDMRSGNYDIYARRVSSSGAVQWTADGAAISAAAGDQQDPQLVSDDSGGAIIDWYDYRSGLSDIYAAGASASGRQ